MKLPSLLLLALCSVAAADDLALLRGLKPLQKTHHCWPVERDQLVARDPRLAEYVRITRSIGVRGEWGSGAAEEMRASVELCKPHGATIALHYSPWHSTYGKTEIDAGPDPREISERTERAYSLCETRLTAIARLLAEANAEHNTNVPVAVVWLDSEVFHRREQSEAYAAQWNAALAEKLSRFYRIAKAIFPDVPVRWYNRGTEDRLFPGNEAGDGYATSLYNTQKIEATRSHYAWSVARSPDGHSIPWLALGGGWWWNENGTREWITDRQYSTCTSFWLGAEVNQVEYPDRYAPWHQAESVVLYPGPFNPAWPHWTAHFIAYVRGANSIARQTTVRPFVQQMKGPGRVVSFDTDGDGDVDMRDFQRFQIGEQP